MPFAIFENENAANGIPPKSQYQTGISDLDPTGAPVEQGILLPFAGDAQATWNYYDCSCICYLDSGIVVHRLLPQSDPEPDSLGSYDVAASAPDKLTGMGVNLKSNDSFADVVQRMAHSRYWFNLVGKAIRVGQQIPIPKLVSIGGQTAVPDDERPQMGYNYIAGNWSGQVIYAAVWSLWYTIATPPTTSKAFVPPNLAAHAGEDDDVGKGPQAPFSQPDDEAVESAPSGLLNPIQ